MITLIVVVIVVVVNGIAAGNEDINEDFYCVFSCPFRAGAEKRESPDHGGHAERAVTVFGENPPV